MQIQAALASFLVQLQADGRSPHTVAQYARHLRRFAAWAESEELPDDVRDVDPGHVARFLAPAEARRRPDGKATRDRSVRA